MANATIGDMQGQVNALTSKLTRLPLRSKQPQRLNKPKSCSGSFHPQQSRGHQENHNGKQAPERLQARIDDQQKRLKTRKTRSPRTARTWKGFGFPRAMTLNGSIAKTQRGNCGFGERGERSYFEFDLKKSKEFNGLDR